MLSEKSNYQLLKMSNVYQNELRLDRNASYWENINDKVKEFLLRKGDSVLTLTGTVGKKDFGYSVMINDSDKYLLNQRLVLLREKKGKSINGYISQILLSERFLFYFFAEAKGGTGNQTNVGVEDIKNIQLYFPIIFEQQKISSFLALIDNRIQTQKKIISQLTSQMLNLKDLIFEQKLKFKDDQDANFPDWKESKIENICEKQSSSISANKIEDNIGDYPIYGATGILKNIDFYEVESDYISIIKDGAGVGRLLYCKGKSSVLGTLDIIKPKNINIFFLYLLLSRIDFKKYITGSTIPHIYFKDYKKEKHLIPSIEEQFKIANFLSSIQEKIEIQKQILEKLEFQKKFLLANLFV